MPRLQIAQSIPRFRQLNFLSWKAYVVQLSLYTVMLCLLLLANPASAETRDPLEPVNRVTFAFNRFVDTLLFKPIASTYKTVLPEFAQRGLKNFFQNLGDVGVAVNNGLQGKFAHAGSDLGRVAINSTLGIGGLFDVASHSFKMPRHEEDFGQTLARWRIASGPYLVLPLFGPSTLRDALGTMPASYLDPVSYVPAETSRSALAGTRVIGQRSAFIDIEDYLTGDSYLYMREAWLQNREFKVSDGNVEIASTF